MRTINRPIDVCFLCGSSDVSKIAYLRLNSDSFRRNLGYLLPVFFGMFFSRMSAKFSEIYRPVLINKKYFSQSAVFCKSCSTGSYRPPFEKSTLDRYYEEFYWNNRAEVDGHHIPDENQPHEKQIALSRDRIDWVKQKVGKIDSIIDFGAGDCAAGFELKNNHGVGMVHVVDPSVQARNLAEKYGLNYSKEIVGAPEVDLVYSAHSIEHVHDLLTCMRELLQKIKPGGHIFIETPNVGNQEIFSTLAHTPHTLMLSRQTFVFMEKLLPVKIIAMEACGPAWQKGHSRIKSEERSDLRVLMLKTNNT